MAKKKNNKNAQRQQAQAKKQTKPVLNRDHMEEMGEDIIEAASGAGHEIAKDVKKGLKKTGKKISKTLKKASVSIDKMSD